MVQWWGGDDGDGDDRVAGDDDLMIAMKIQ